MERTVFRVWQVPAAILLFLAGTLAFSHLPYDRESERYPGTVEAAFYSMGLFLGRENPIGFPGKGGPGWAITLGRFVYFASPIVLGWAVIEASLRFTGRFARTVLANPERLIDRLDGHVIVCGLGKLGNMVLDLLHSAGAPLVAVERNPENQYLEALLERRIPLVAGDMTVPDTLRRAGVERARKIIAISGDDIANLDAAHLARKLNRDISAVCQVTDVQLQKLVEQARELDIRSFNSYDVAAKKLIDSEIRPDVGDDPKPLFILAGIGRFGRMMVSNLVAMYGHRQVKILIVDKLGSHIARVLKGTLRLPETYLQEGTIYQADITDPFVWRTIRDDHDVSKGTVVLCTDNDISNINTALMIEDQIGREILVVSRMFRDVSFMERREGRFRIAVLTRLIRTGILEEIEERAAVS